MTILIGILSYLLAVALTALQFVIIYGVITHDKLWPFKWQGHKEFKKWYWFCWWDKMLMKLFPKFYGWMKQHEK